MDIILNIRNLAATLLQIDPFLHNFKVLLPLLMQSLSRKIYFYHLRVAMSNRINFN